VRVDHDHTVDDLAERFKVGSEAICTISGNVMEGRDNCARRTAQGQRCTVSTMSSVSTSHQIPQREHFRCDIHLRLSPS
jgi:hypothetical protein